MARKNTFLYKKLLLAACLTLCAWPSLAQQKPAVTPEMYSYAYLDALDALASFVLMAHQRCGQPADTCKQETWEVLFEQLEKQHPVGFFWLENIDADKMAATAEAFQQKIPDGSTQLQANLARFQAALNKARKGAIKSPEPKLAQQWQDYLAWLNERRRLKRMRINVEINMYALSSLLSTYYEAHQRFPTDLEQLYQATRDDPNWEIANPYTGKQGISPQGAAFDYVSYRQHKDVAGLSGLVLYEFLSEHIYRLYGSDEDGQLLMKGKDPLSLADDQTPEEDKIRGQVAALSSQIQANPKDASAYLARAKLYDDLGDYEAALADYTQAIALAGDKPEIYVQRGDAFSNLEKYPEALADYNRAIALAPSNPEYVKGRGDLFYAQEKYPEAIADYNQAIALDPAYYDAYFKRAWSHYYLKQPEQSLKDMDTLVELGQKQEGMHIIHALYQRAGMYTSLQRFDQALADYDKALELNPELFTTFQYRGGLFHRVGQYAQAVQDLTKAIELVPMLAYLYHLRGESYAAWGKHAEALADFDKALQMEPEAKVFLSRSRLHQKMGNCEKARADFKQACALGNEEACQMKCP